VDITIYLPDELGQRAKSRPDINLSRMLRDALEEQFEEEAAMVKTLEEATVHKLNLEDDDGRSYVGTITGTKIADSSKGDVEVFLTDEQNVLVYDVDKQRYYVDTGELDLEEVIGDRDAYMDAMHALGRTPTVALGV